jgi:GDP-L-fucose synthase
MLITGGTGFLGRAVAERLPAAHAVGSDDADLTDGRAAAELIGDLRPRVVVHLAARVGGIEANLARPADFLVDNLRIDGNLLAALRDHPPEHLVVMLSTCMYPDRLPEGAYPLTEDRIEDGPPPPTNAAYAAAKRALLHGVHALRTQVGVPFTALVPSNLYGPGDDFESPDAHFLAAAVGRIEAARRAGAGHVTFLGTGRPLRQFLFVEDLADLVALVVESGPLDDVLNVAPEGHASIRELAGAVARAADWEGEIRFPGVGPDGQLRKDVSCARLRTHFPEWDDIETPLEEGLARTVAWHRRHVEAR